MSKATKSSYSSPAMLAGILSKSSRVISDHSRHFLLLSLLFLLPLSSLLISSPSLLPLLLHHPHPHPHPPISPPTSPSLPNLTKTLILAAASFALLLPISSAAISSATRRVNNAFYGRQVKILPNLKSLRIQTLHLLSTILSIILIFSAIVALIDCRPTRKKKLNYSRATRKLGGGGDFAPTAAVKYNVGSDMVVNV